MLILSAFTKHYYNLTWGVLFALTLGTYSSLETTDSILHNEYNNASTGLLMAAVGDVCSTITPTDLGGCVFQDFNANGIKDAEEPYLYGVEVALYDDNAQVGATLSTNADGEYIFSGLNLGQTYRVEFTIPFGMEEGPTGADSKSSVQFAQSGTCTASLGFLDPTDYCDVDPDVVIPCYAELEYDGTYATEPALAKLRYSEDGHHFTGTTKLASYAASSLATHNDIGAVYGMAYQRTKGKMYLGAFHKRYVDFGPNGPDAIYQIDTAGTITGVIELDALIAGTNNAGTDVHDFALSGGQLYDIGTANASFDGVGKRAFGDLEISADNQNLYAVNLFDRKIYSFDVSTGIVANVTVNNSWNAPDATGANRHRPFGLAWHHGKLWIGSVDENASNAYIHSLDPSGTTFTLELTVDLSYSRQSITGYSDTSKVGDWNAWESDPETLPYLNHSGTEIFYPMPILSDIEFDGENMMLGFRDRFGDQSTGDKRFKISATIDTWGDAGGDLLKVCYINGSYVLETGSTGACPCIGGLDNSGPNGFEFYHWDTYEFRGITNPNLVDSSFHWETAQGGLLQLDGKPSILTTAMDPFNDFSGGLLKFDNTTGNREGMSNRGYIEADLTGGYTLYETGDYSGGPPAGNGTAAKANGLGDIEAFCSAAPLEIGNYVWFDLDKDGIQDPSETGIANLRVNLTASNDVVLGTVVTDSEGRYSFTSADITGELDYFTDYKIKIDIASLKAIQPTLGNVTSLNTGNGLNDNDATLVGTYAEATITTGGPGETEHALDFGFVEVSNIGNRVWLDENSNGLQDAGEPGIPGVVMELQNGTCSAGVDCPTTITDADGGYIFTNVPLGSYTVKVASNVPTGMLPIYDEDNGTTSPNMEAVVVLSATDEYVTADFAYNYTTKADTDSPASIATGALGSRIWNDANGNGVQDPGEAGIENITLNLLTDPDLDGVYTPSGTTTTTDAYGNYIFDGLAPGAYEVEVVDAGLTSAGFVSTPTGDPDNDANNISDPILIAPGDVYLAANFGYDSAADPADIGSTVYVDVDGSGSFNTGDIPLSGVTIALIADTDGGMDWDINEELVATTTTASDGTYLFPDLSAGDYVVVVTDVNNVINSLSNTVDPQGANDGVSGLTLAAADNLGQNFGYVPGAHVNGKGFIGDLVFLDANTNTSFDIGDTGIEGVEIELLSMVIGGVENGVQNPDFESNNLTNWTTATTGTTTIGTTSVQSHAGTYSSIIVVGDDGQQGTISQIVTGLEPSTTYTATVWVLGSNGNAQATITASNYNGAATIADVSSETAWNQLSITFTTGATDTSVDIELLADKVNLNGVARTVYIDDFYLERNSMTSTVVAKTVTNENGNYFFGNLDDGDYMVKVIEPTLPSGIENNIDPDGSSPSDNLGGMVNITGGSSNLDQDFGYIATTPRSIAGTIWTDDNADGTLDGTEAGRYEGVSLNLIDDNGNILASTVTATNGTYSFTQIPAGDYTVEVTDEDNILLGDWHSIGTDSEITSVPVTVAATNITNLDFGYYHNDAALGNVVWEDLNNDGLQTTGEPGIAGVTVLLEIDFDNNGSADATVATMTDLDGHYSFDNLLLDESDNGTGITAEYEILVVNPVGYEQTLTDVASNTNDKTDADNPMGVAAFTVQGQSNTDKAVDPTTEPIAASYDFGFIRTSAIGNYVWLDENGDGQQDVGEPGIPNVRVDLRDESNNFITSTSTDANGGYVFRGLGAGTYNIAIIAGTLPSGLTHQTYDSDANNDGTTTVVLGSREEMGIDFGYNYAPVADTDTPTIADLGAIGDRIWNDANSDGIQDAGEAGIKGVTIELWSDANADGTYTYSGVNTTTDAAGRYIFDDLPLGAYAIRVDDTALAAAGFTISPTGDPDRDADNMSEPVVIAPGDVYLNMDFGYNLPTGSNIGSSIYLDENGNTAFDSEKGIAGITVSLENASQEIIATTTTDANGNYLFEGLPDGTYTVVVSDTENVLQGLSESGDPDGATARESIVVLSGADELAENFGFAPQGHTTGAGMVGNLVFFDMDGNDSYTVGEPGIEGVTVSLVDLTTTRVVGTTVTNENGEYYFGALSAANYKVVLDESTLPVGLTNSVDPDNAGLGNESGTISLAAAEVNLLQDFGYKATTPYNISGTIWEDMNADGIIGNETATELDGITVNLYDTDGNIIARDVTDTNGEYDFLGLPNGDYIVKVSGSNDSLMGYWHSLGTDSEADPYTVTINNANIADVDFGYYIEGAAVGNKIWIDYNTDDAQDTNEPGLPGAKLSLEIDYNNDGTPDLTLVDISDVDGNYFFKGLLLDEDYNGLATTPDYELVVTLPDTDMNATYAEVTPDGVGVDDKMDSETHAGQILSVVQGKSNVATQAILTTEATEASYDFGYSLDCSIPMVDYAMTMDATDAGAAQTTDHFVDSTSVTSHTAMTQKFGEIRSWTYCTNGAWNYYYNPLDPSEFLFAIEHGANTTAIDYIEIRVDDDATDRYAEDGQDATFVMMRDWKIKTENDAALTAPINIRFYFPPNEYKQMLDAAKAQATTWGVSDTPDESDVQWFKKDEFNPDVDVVATNATLNPFDATSLRVAASDANGNNTALSSPALENSRNHIQMNAVTGTLAGTAMIHINRASLPVDLSMFEGRVDECNTVLQWRTETEDDFDYFDLEWSNDGVNFRSIEIINANGGHAISQNYYLEHKDAWNKNYYRLKMVDLDLSFEYSNTVYLETGCNTDENTMTVFPNPVSMQQNIISIKFFSESEEVELQIVNTLGQVVRRMNLGVEPTWNTLRMDITDLAEGTYFIKQKGKRGAVSFIVME